MLPDINPSGKIKNIFVKINLKSKKWLISGSYDPDVGLIQIARLHIKENLEFYSFNYENFIAMDDFNPEMIDTYPAGNYMFKVNIRNTRKRCEISLLLTLNKFHTFF